MTYGTLHQTMTTHLTEELVHWDLAEPPDGPGGPEDDPVEETAESTFE